jgi:methionyl-tRNA formyltransferase
MKVTLFTSNNHRHNYLINLLSNICDELWVVQECEKLSPEKNTDRYIKSKIIENYFKHVKEAENKIFREEYKDRNSKNTQTLSIPSGEINNLTLSSLENFLKSDIYVVFGSSYIKGNLINFLISQKSINIHAGVSPYYRGTDCNFWALYDNNPHLVGATIHMLSKGIDSGSMLYHAMSKIKTNPFEYTMSTIKAAFHSVAERIKDKSIFEIKPVVQNRKKEIRYSKKIEFNDQIVNEYFNKEINLNSKKFDNSLLKDPYFFEN